MARQAWMACVLLLAGVFAGSAVAGIADVRKTIEASMLVTGTIEVDAEGKVAGFELDHRDRIPAHARQLVEQAVPAWRFEPTRVDGKAAWVRTPMHLRLVASRVDGGKDAVALRIASASFGAPEAFAPERNHPPTYPREALMRGVGGSVYLVLKLDPEGRVMDVATEQVNLRYLGNEREMDRMRGLLARAAERAARRWSLVPPSAGLDAGESSWSARVPVDFTINDDRSPTDGSWTPYIPGPRHQVPWLEGADAGSNDAYLAGGVYPVGQGLKLLTSLEAEG